MLWLWTVLLCPLIGSSAEGKSPKKVMGILGEDATFLLESPTPFDRVLWFRNEVHQASWRRVPPCELKKHREYTSREVTVSQDCSSLTVRGLREEDSALYKAQMQKNDEVVGSQTFTLKVYKRLSEADLKVVCAREILKDGNETLCLNCSVGQWEDGVEYSWTSSGQGGQVVSSGKSLVLLYNPQDDDQNVTCMVKNPVGNTSRTVSLKQTCASGNTDNPSRLPSEAGIGVTIAALIVAKVIISGCVFAKWPSCTKLTAQS